MDESNFINKNIDWIKNCPLCLLICIELSIICTFIGLFFGQKSKDWLKAFFFIIFTIVFSFGGYLLWSNTKPQEPKSIQELINIIQENTNKRVILDPVTVHTSKIDDFLKNYTVIRKDDFDDTIKAVALVSRQEAAEDYHKSFSIFVAMLAIFGIGFPVFVAFLQHSFNEKQLEKIETTSEAVEVSKKQADAALKEAKDTSAKVIEAKDQADHALEQAKETATEANNAKEQANKALKQAQETSKQTIEAKKKAQVALQQAMTTSKQAKNAQKQADEALGQAKDTTKQANEAKDQADNALGQTQELSKHIVENYKDISNIQFNVYNEIIAIEVWLKAFYEGSPSENIKDIMSIYLAVINQYHTLQRYYIVNTKQDIIEGITQEEKNNIEEELQYIENHIKTIENNKVFIESKTINEDEKVYIQNIVIGYNAIIQTLHKIEQIESKSEERKPEEKESVMNRIKTIQDDLQLYKQKLEKRILKNNI